MGSTYKERDFANESQISLIISPHEIQIDNYSLPIIINVTARNNLNKTILISKSFQYMGYMDIFLIDINGTSYVSGLIQFDIIIDEKIELKPGQELKYEYNLNNYTPFNKYGGSYNFDFPQKGEYELYMIYKSSVKSNSIALHVSL